jgi:hypothetical protein
MQVVAGSDQGAPGDHGSLQEAEMRKSVVVAAAAALAGLGALAACDNGTDLVTTLVNNNCANLAGLFTATSMTATAKAHVTPHDSAGGVHDYLANGGAFSLVFSNSGGTFNSSFTQQTKQAPLVQTGAVTTAGNTITLGNNTLFEPGITGPQTFTCAISAPTLSLVDSAATFPFAGDTVPEPAIISITLTH